MLRAIEYHQQFLFHEASFLLDEQKNNSESSIFTLLHVIAKDEQELFALKEQIDFVVTCTKRLTSSLDFMKKVPTPSL